jgi:hypothetical protein
MRMPPKKLIKIPSHPIFLRVSFKKRKAKRDENIGLKAIIRLAVPAVTVFSPKTKARG